jgi:hypothetical protein
MLVLSGMRPSKRWPHLGSYRDKNEWMRNKAIQKLDKNIGDREVKWANNLSNPSITPVTLEIKLCNREITMKLKRIFRDLKRDDMKIQEDIYISNNYTAATKVRVEIMKAIVKKCASNEDRMFLHQFCNRPFVRLTNTQTKIERILTFTNLVENYGCQMDDKELEIAYRRAGFKFRGQMRQVFGILKEREEMKQHHTQTQRPTHHNNQNDEYSNNKTIGTRKRRAQADDHHNKRTKKKSTLIQSLKQKCI